MSSIIVMKTDGEGAPEVERGQADQDVLLEGEYKTATYNHWTGEEGRLALGVALRIVKEIELSLPSLVGRTHQNA